MPRLHGRKGEIGIAASVTPEGSPAVSDFTAVGSLRSWNLSFSRTPVESTSLRSASRTFLPGLTDISGSFDGVFDTDSIQTLLAASEDQDAVWIRITPDKTTYPELFFQGSAWVNVTCAGSVSDAVRASGTFLGNSVWQKSFSS